MTVIENTVCEHPEEILTLPDLPEEYLRLTLLDTDPLHREEILESYPLAVSDVTAERILDSKKLTYGENVKETYSLEISTSFSSFKAGDTIGIITRNRDDDIRRLFNHLGIATTAHVPCLVTEINPTSRKNQAKPSFLDKATTRSHIFTNLLDIQSIPKKSLIRILAEYTEDVKEKKKLEELCSKEKSNLYTKEILDASVTFLDLLLMFPTCQPPPVRLMENLPKLQPRPYSIASSPLASPDKIKIVFSVIKTNNNREGLCTGMLKEMITNKQEKLKFYHRKSNDFNLPETDVPVILVGPGTGIAPFMGFLEDRKMQKSGGGSIWLFYGCRSQTGDYLFKEELQNYLDLGVLDKLYVAFSRENDAEARYVQDNIRKYGKEITSLILDKNAAVYVCGDAKNMRKDIQNSFIEIFEKHKGMTNKEATDFIKKLQKSKRYLQDIWA